MIPNDTTKAAVVARLQVNSTLIARFPDGSQGVREYGWRGNQFQYPNARVEMESQIEVNPGGNCSSVEQPWSVYIFSESHSSQEADDIAGVVSQYFQGSSFDGTGVKFSRVEVLESIPAIPDDERTWRAQVRCRSVIYLG